MLRILASTSDIDASQLAWKGWGIVAFVLAAMMAGVALRSAFGLRLRLRRSKPADVITTA
jgi:hypothetical protein